MAKITSVGWVRGMEDLRKVLRSIDPQSCAEMLEPAVKAAVAPILIAAKRYARRSRETGALDQSLVAKVVPYKSSGTVVGMVGPDRAYYLKGRKAGPLARLQAGLRRPANYAHLVEYGHHIAVGGSLRGKHEIRLVGTGRYSAKGREYKRWKRGALIEAAKGRSGGFVAPRPFLRPAVITTRAQQYAAFEAALKASMNRHFNKANRGALAA